MAYSVNINGVSYALKEGITIKEVANENLDNAVAVIPQVAEITSLEPYDIAAIYDGTTLIKKLLVGDITSTIASFTPALYNYFLGLVSPTQMLRTITLPNLSITQPLTGAKRDIAYHLQRLKDVYLDFESETYYYDADLLALAAGTICPEEAFNKPNAWEFLNTLVKPLNIIIKVDIDENDEFKISYLNLNERANAFDVTKYSMVTKQQSLSEYASELDIETENALYPLTSGVDTFAKTNIRTTARASTGLQITDENLEIILPYPIYRLNKVIASLWYVAIVNEEPTTGYVELDITNRVISEAEYNTLKTLAVDGEMRKNNCIYYSENSNVIKGLGFRPNALLNRSIQNVLFEARKGIVAGDSFTPAVDLKDILYTISYVTTANIRMRTSKATKLKHNVILTNNQQNSFVDLKLLGEQEKQNINRLGNDRLTAIGVFLKTDALPMLFDVYGNYILTSIEKQYNDYSVSVKAEYSKNFINKTSFSGINYKRRITSIASSGEAFLRHDLIKRYCLFSFSNIVVADYSYNAYLLKTITDKTAKALNLVVFETSATIENDIPKLSSGFTKYASGNSVLVSFGAEDNLSVGLRIYDNDNGLQERCKYTDNNGEFTNMNIYAYNDWSSVASGQIPNYPAQKTFSETYPCNYPLIDNALLDVNNLIFSVLNKKIYKDNREIMKITIQDEFLSDDPDNIIVGKAFIEKNIIIRDVLSAEDLYLYSSTTATYAPFENETCKGTSEALVVGTNITTTDNYINVSTNESWASWAIGNADGDMYLAVNGHIGLIYLNIKNNR